MKLLIISTLQDVKDLPIEEIINYINNTHEDVEVLRLSQEQLNTADPTENYFELLSESDAILMICTENLHKTSYIQRVINLNNSSQKPVPVIPLYKWVGKYEVFCRNWRL